jgi:hypothetical protein
MLKVTSITFKPPTTNTDGTPLTTADVKQYDIGLGTAPGVYSLIVADANVTPDPTSGLIAEPGAALGVIAPGSYFMSARTVHVDGQVSAWASPVAFTINAPPPVVPNPPSDFTVA